MMRILGSGSIQNYVNTMKLKVKMQERIKNPLMAKGREEDPKIASLKRSAESLRKGNAIASIDGKLKSGQKLSSEDLDYLRANSPERYKEAVEVEKERENYKKALRRCKTKEDVEKLNSQKLQNFLAETSAVKNNPDIPLIKKMEKLEQISRRLMGTQNEYLSFIKSSEYSKLPEESKEEEKTKKKVVQKKEQGSNEKVDLFKMAEEFLNESISEVSSEFKAETFEIKLQPSPEIKNEIGASHYNNQGNQESIKIQVPKISVKA